MSTFESTSKRLQNLKARIPEFPLEKMRLVRLTYHLQKNLRDLTNAALKRHKLVDASYLVLAVLYGSEDETSSASALGLACHEKPANLTRLCNDLEQRGLILRGSRPGDRRSVMISLTAAGRKTIETVLPAMWQNAVPVYDGLSAEELQQLDDLLSRQLRNLEKMTQPWPGPGPLR
ncbi:MAG TPA: MarR family transcriptional regulator [Janthinobacterium sp.]|jgi:MarR family transcriptional repressor of emrRAB|nr:MarR family transcriptional regulator [Janthinobacterium sp.]